MSEEERIKLIEFGRGGHVAHVSRNCRIEGYAAPETLFVPFHWWADPPGKLTFHVEPEKSEGAVVLDKLPAIKTREGFKWVFRGPLVNVDLADGEEDRIDDALDHSILAKAVKMEPGNEFGEIVRIHEAAKALNPGAPGPLDTVSIAEYVAGWKRVGARVGVVRAGKIEWEA